MSNKKNNEKAMSDRALELVMRDVLEGMRARSLQQFRNEAHARIKITEPTSDDGSRLYAIRPHPESNGKLHELNCRKLNS